MATNHRLRSEAYRQKSRRSDAKMNRDQVMAAYRLYREGFSVPRIAELVWERFGFASKNSCITRLYQDFYSYRLATRSRRDYGGRCSGCRCDLDDRTRECDQCNSRHSARRRIAGRPPAAELGCKGCGCALDSRTRGCQTCMSRHSDRRRRQSPPERLGASTLMDTIGPQGRLQEAAC